MPKIKLPDIASSIRRFTQVNSSGAGRFIDLKYPNEPPKLVIAPYALARKAHASKMRPIRIKASALLAANSSARDRAP
jgi:hypothetical protein